MVIITAIEAHLDKLRPSELLVANFVLGRPSVVVHMSIADIAESCSVSEPTIMRFCKALGCLGFMEFKLALARDLERRTFTMSRANPAVKGPTGFGQALFARSTEMLGAGAQFLALDRLDEILEFIGASRAITVLHDGSETRHAQALVDELLNCRLEARAQDDLVMRGRSDGRVILALQSAANLSRYEDFLASVLKGEGKTIVLGQDSDHASISIDLVRPSDMANNKAISESLTYLSLLETVRLGIASRLSRDGAFSETAADMLQSQREIAYGDARRRDRQSAQSQDGQNMNTKLFDGEVV